MRKEDELELVCAFYVCVLKRVALGNYQIRDDNIVGYNEQKYLPKNTVCYNCTPHMPHIVSSRTGLQPKLAKYVLIKTNFKPRSDFCLGFYGITY